MIRAYDSGAVRAAEAPLLEAGVPLMSHAAHALAVRAIRELQAAGARVPGSVVLALAGGGNNGGDALFAAAILARRGVSVTAALCAPEVHAAGLAAARRANVRISPIVVGDAVHLPLLLDTARRAGVWLDGLAGIGLTGALRAPYAEIIAALAGEKAASPDEPIVIAVDTPSGVGDDGVVRGPLLPANVTVTMGAAKPGLLLPPASAYAGEVQVVELGLPLAGSEPAVERLTAGDVADAYPWPRQQDHKYTRGVVGIWAGSDRFPGAAFLSAAGALAAGPGMVRYLGAVPGLPHVLPEVVTDTGRIQAGVIGSGISPAAAASALAGALARRVPLVVDAGGLDSVGALVDPHRSGPPIVITPHAGELAAMLGIDRAAVEAEPARHARAAARRFQVVVLCKGPTTLVVPPAGPILSQEIPSAWLASAGSGDVLGGIIGTLLALAQARAEESGEDGGLTQTAAARVAAAGVWLHSEAALRIGQAPAAGPIRASQLPPALQGVLAALPH